MRNKQKKKMLKTNTKISSLIWFLAFLVFIYIIRLFSLQILDVYDYKVKGNNVSLQGKEIQPERGDILDRNGQALAISQNIESLYLLPVTSQEKSDEAEAIRLNEVIFNSLSEDEKEYYTKQSSLPVYKDEEIDKIASILEIDRSIIDDLIADNAEGYIYRALNTAQKEQIKLLDLNYLLYVPMTDRYYPNDQILANTLGFVDNDGRAYYGLENSYDEILSGVTGYREFFKALQGTEIPYSNNESFDPQEANNLKTSIDIDLQKILYNHLLNAMFDIKPMSATAILSDPNTGEILAMESLPSFDANQPRDLSSELDQMFVENIADDSQYLLSRWPNNAVSMQYEPGSVFKIITSAVALETHNELKDKVYQDNGFYEIVPGVTIRSWRYWDPHGPQNLREALKNSSNPVFVQLIQDIGKEDFINTASSFRLGMKSGIDLPGEIDGFFPTSTAISDVDFGVMSYGYYLNVNPVQFISTLNSLVNGGKYYTPHIGKEIISDNGDVIYEIGKDYISRPISESTSKELNSYLEYTADNYGINTEDLKFGAKTGTVDKNESSSIFTDSPGYAKYTSTYITYPADNPQYSLLVVLDEALVDGNASSSALPLARDIIYDVVEEVNGDIAKIDVNESLIKIPNVEGLTLEDANKIMKESNIDLTTSDNQGKFTIVETQTPKAGNFIEEGQTVSVDLSDKFIVPDLVGIDIDEALELLEYNGIKYKVDGQGQNIFELSSKPGSQMNLNETLTIFTRSENE